MHGMEGIMVLVVGLIIAVIPVKFAAGAMGAERTEFGWCLLALIVATVLHSVGMNIAPVYGTIVAFILAGVGFMLVLRSGFFAGLGIAILHYLFTLAIAWLLTKLGFGMFARTTVWDILNLVK